MKKTDRFAILTVGNNKGGVGKSFLSKMLAEYAAMRLGLRTLIIDLDPQTNISKRYLEMERIPDAIEDYIPPVHPSWTPEDQEWDGRSSSAEIWNVESGMIVPYPTSIEGLDILPGHAQKLENIERVLVQDVWIQVVERLREFLALPEVREMYDLVVVDTRPSKGPLTTSGVMAATHLVIPTEMEAPSVEGLYGMLSLQTQVNLRRPRHDQVELIGILPNKVQPTVLHRDFMAMLKDDPQVRALMLDEQLGYRTDFKKSMLSADESLFKKPVSNKAREEAESVCKSIYQGVYGDYFDRLTLAMEAQAA